MGQLEKEWVEVLRPKVHDGLPLLGPFSQCAFPEGIYRALKGLRGVTRLLCSGHSSWG